MARAVYDRRPHHSSFRANVSKRVDQVILTWAFRGSCRDLRGSRDSGGPLALMGRIGVEPTRPSGRGILRSSITKERHVSSGARQFVPEFRVQLCDAGNTKAQAEPVISNMAKACRIVGGVYRTTDSVPRFSEPMWMKLEKWWPCSTTLSPGVAFKRSATDCKIMLQP